MKKSFINDIKTFIVEILITAFFVYLFFACLISETGKVALIVWGIITLLGLFLLSLSTEVITVDVDKIISKKIWKQKKILYIDIVRIEQGLDIVLDGCAVEGWKITDFRNQSIFLVETKKRKTDIDFIKQCANQRLQ